MLLKKWIRSSGYFSEKVELKNGPLGRGIFASQKIPKGDLIMRITRDKQFTVEDAFHSMRSEIYRSIKNNNGNFSTNPAAILTVGFANEVRKGRHSK